MEKNDKYGAIEGYENKLERMKKICSLMSMLKKCIDESTEDLTNSIYQQFYSPTMTERHENLMRTYKLFTDNLHELIEQYSNHIKYLESMTAIYAPPDVFKAKKNQDDESNNQDEENSH